MPSRTPSSNGRPSKSALPTRTQSLPCAIAEDGKRSETDVAFELESPSLVTIGVCYEKNARFSGGAYNSVVSKCESFATEPMAKSLKMREAHADKLLELDEAVGEAVTKLKAAGFTSGYLKPIVVARVNPLRFAKPGKDEKSDFDKTIDKMIEGAKLAIEEWNARGVPLGVTRIGVHAGVTIAEIA